MVNQTYDIYWHWLTFLSVPGQTNFFFFLLFLTFVILPFCDTHKLSLGGGGVESRKLLNEAVGALKLN